MEYEVEHVLAEDDTVALRYTAHGTHDGEFMGLEPTGDQVSVSGMEMYRIEDEQIAEMWTSYDALGLFQELGVVPPLEDLARAPIQRNLSGSGNSDRMTPRIMGE